MTKKHIKNFSKKQKKQNTSKSLITYLYIVAIIIVTFFSFLPSLFNNFTNWDDNVFVTENPDIRGFSVVNIKAVWTSSYVCNYQPITMLTYMLDYTIFKLNPFGYHLTNLIVHLLNCLLVYYLIYLISANSTVAFITSVFFGIHPLRVESVAWIAERKDMVSGFLFLISVVLYLHYVKNRSCGLRIDGKKSDIELNPLSFKKEPKYKNQNEFKKSYKFYILSLLFFLLSLLAKPMAVTLPVVLLTFDFLVGRKFDKGSILEKIPFLGLSIIFSIITLMIQETGGAIPRIFPFYYKMLIASHGVIFYILKLIIPIKLSALYPHPDPYGTNLPLFFYISPIIIILIVYIIFKKLHKNRNFIFGILFFIITISPVIQLIPVGSAIAADRYTYIPFIGLFYIVSLFLPWLYFEKCRNNINIRSILIIFFICVIAVFSALTYKRCKVWKSDLILWDDVITKYQTSALAYLSRGIAYLDEKNYEKAISDFDIALKLQPGYGDVFFSRGIAFMNLLRLEQALDDFDIAINKDPKKADGYHNRGNVYLLMKKYDKAILDFNKAIELDKRKSDFYYSRAIAYASIDENDKVITDIDSALSVNPKDTEAYLIRGDAFFKKQDYEKAVSDYSKAISLNPNFYEAISARAKAYLMLNKSNEAKKDVQRLRDSNYPIDPQLINELK